VIATASAAIMSRRQFMGALDALMQMHLFKLKTIGLNWLGLFVVGGVIVGAISYWIWGEPPSVGMAVSAYAMCICGCLWIIASGLLRSVATLENLRCVAHCQRFVGLCFSVGILGITFLLSTFVILQEWSFLLILALVAALSVRNMEVRILGMVGCGLLAVAVMAYAIWQGAGVLDVSASPAERLLVGIAILIALAGLSATLAMSTIFPWMNVIPLMLWLVLVILKPLQRGTFTSSFAEIAQTFTLNIVSNAALTALGFVICSYALIWRRSDKVGSFNVMGKPNMPSRPDSASNEAFFQVGILHLLPGYDFSLNRSIQLRKEPMRLLPFVFGRGVHWSVWYWYAAIFCVFFAFSIYSDIKFDRQEEARSAVLQTEVCAKFIGANAHAECISRTKFKSATPSIKSSFPLAIGIFLGFALLQLPQFFQQAAWRTRHDQKLLSLAPRWRSDSSVAHTLLWHFMQICVVFVLVMTAYVVLAYLWRTAHLEVGFGQSIAIIKALILMLIFVALFGIYLLLYLFERLQSVTKKENVLINVVPMAIYLFLSAITVASNYVSWPLLEVGIVVMLILTIQRARSFVQIQKLLPVGNRH
jgi:hypothetical protein